MCTFQLIIVACITYVSCETARDLPARTADLSLSPSDTLDVWLLLGQSNLVGDNGYDQQPLPRESEPLPSRAFAWSFRWKVWEQANNNIAMRSHGVDSSAMIGRQKAIEYVSQCAGPELAFARTLISLKVSTKIGFIPWAMGGRSLTTQDCANCSDYQGIVSSVKEAMGAAKGRVVLRGVLFAQGEMEATSREFCSQCPDLAIRWGAEFRALVLALRRDLSGLYHHKLPVVMGVISEREGFEGEQETLSKGLKVYMANLTLVRHHQLAVEMEDLIKVDQQGAAYFRQSWGVEVGRILLHISKTGQAQLGRLYALEYYLWYINRRQGTEL